MKLTIKFISFPKKRDYGFEKILNEYFPELLYIFSTVIKCDVVIEEGKLSMKSKIPLPMYSLLPVIFLNEKVIAYMSNFLNEEGIPENLFSNTTICEDCGSYFIIYDDKRYDLKMKVGEISDEDLLSWYRVFEYCITKDIYPVDMSNPESDSIRVNIKKR